MKTAPLDRISGILLGTLVGDALGLPAEGLRPAAIRRLGWQDHWKHRFFFGRGMASDDTEHTIMLSQALLASKGDSERFVRLFASELRWWMLGLPAGVGLATARATFRLWLGISPLKSGVFSAGNGPSMRSAIIGAFFPGDRSQRHAFTAAHTRITHSDPKALIAAHAVTELGALLASTNQAPDSDIVLKHIRPSSSDPEWEHILSMLQKSCSEGIGLPEFLSAIGADPAKGISGYAYHTVPAVIFSGLRHDWNFQATLTSVLNAGGDTDTTGAIAGALCGAFGGERAIPPTWLDRVKEWPVSTSKLRRLAPALCQGHPIRIRAHWSPALLFRNLFFLIIVLIHGFARLGRAMISNVSVRQ